MRIFAKYAMKLVVDALKFSDPKPGGSRSILPQGLTRIGRASVKGIGCIEIDSNIELSNATARFKTMLVAESILTIELVVVEALSGW